MAKFPPLAYEMLETDFNAFQREFRHKFQSLAFSQKTQIIKILIDLCEAKELTYLFDHLDVLQKRDFIRFLPPEVVRVILGFLDCKTLFLCYLVSKQWNKKISSCDSIWRKACLALGWSNKSECSSWKDCYLAASQTLKQIGKPENMQTSLILQHHAKVCAVHCDYLNKRLTTGTMDGEVCLFDLKSNLCVKSIKTHSCAAIQFTDELLYTASFDNTIYCHRWSDESVIGKYIGHTGAVFTISLHPCEDLLLSGASDSAVCLWKASSFEMIAQWTGHRGWVSQVFLKPACTASIHHSVHELVALSCDKVDIRVWTNAKDANCVVLENSVASCDDGQSIEHVMFDGRHIVASCKECVLVWNFSDFSLSRHISMHPSYVCVGLGLNWMICFTKHELQLLSVVAGKMNQTSKILVKWKLPYLSIMKHGTSFSVGLLNWLDGNLPNDKQVLFASATFSNRVVLLVWDAIK